MDGEHGFFRNIRKGTAQIDVPGGMHNHHRVIIISLQQGQTERIREPVTRFAYPHGGGSDVVDRNWYIRLRDHPDPPTTRTFMTNLSTTISTMIGLFAGSGMILTVMVGVTRSSVTSEDGRTTHTVQSVHPHFWWTVRCCKMSGLGFLLKREACQ